MGSALSLVLAEVYGGGYISIWKSVLVVLVLLGWARLLTWVDKDAVAAHLPRLPLNLGFLVGMIVTFGLFLLLPMFIVAFAVLLLGLGAEVGIYLLMRQKQVGLADLKGELSQGFSQKFQKKKNEEARQADVIGIINKAGQAAPIPKVEDSERPAFDTLQSVLTDALRREAERIAMVPSGDGVSVRYDVDGVTYKGETIDRAAGAAAILHLKAAAGLDTHERRKPQRANIKLAVDGRKRDFRIDTLGTTAGESVMLLGDPKKQHDFTLDTLGFNPRQLDIIKGVIQERKGIVLVSAPKGAGLTSMIYGILKGHDAFLTHIHTIEREAEQDLEGITQNKLSRSASGSEESKQVDWVSSQEPEVLMIDRVDDPRTAALLIRFARSGKMVYVGMRAATTFEALSQWRKLVGDDKAAVEELQLIICGRVLRKLCSACKVGYAPDPGTLRKLNMNPDKVSTLYQARSQPLRDAKGNPVPCEFCNDLRFKGRTGFFETFVVDDDVRDVVGSGGSDNKLKAVFRKQRGKYLQEEALSLVERGETSVQEVLRVIKGSGGGEGGAATTQARTPKSPAPTPR